LARYDEAVMSFTLALQHNPDNLIVVLNKGTALLAAGRVKESIDTFDCIIARASSLGLLTGDLIQTTM
jgi:predicted Zn-dependent protease